LGVLQNSQSLHRRDRIEARRIFHRIHRTLVGAIPADAVWLSGLRICPETSSSQRHCVTDVERNDGWFENRKIRHIALTVLADNQPARVIWDKMGFMDFYIFKWKVPTASGIG
jgi:hypothetical protein